MPKDNKPSTDDEKPDLIQTENEGDETEDENEPEDNSGEAKSENGDNQSWLVENLLNPITEALTNLQSRVDSQAEQLTAIQTSMKGTAGAGSSIPKSLPKGKEELAAETETETETTPTNSSETKTEKSSSTKTEAKGESAEQSQKAEAEAEAASEKPEEASNPADSKSPARKRNIIRL